MPADLWRACVFRTSAWPWYMSAVGIHRDQGGMLGAAGSRAAHIWLSASRDEWLWDNRASAAGRKMIRPPPSCPQPPPVTATCGKVEVTSALTSGLLIWGRAGIGRLLMKELPDGTDVIMPVYKFEQVHAPVAKRNLLNFMNILFV